MVNLDVTHNPFTVETSFLIDGHEPESNSQFAEYKTQRLQLWIERFFEKLYDIFNGETQYTIDFKGVEADCIDMKEAVEQANTNGLDVKIKLTVVSGSEERLEGMQQLINEVKQDSLFKQYVNKPDILSKFEAAFDKDFDVYVVATMSSGKSTLINAMLGCDLLPALNEATTATIAKISDNDNMPAGYFKVSCADIEEELIEEEQSLNLSTKQGSDLASQLMSEWNKSPDVFRINVEGKISAIEERENIRLVLTDTPGPNNSQDMEHSLTTMRYIGDSDRNPLVLYILNGQQLGINDDQSLLRQIAEVMSKGGKQSKDRFIFVINKADVFDPEKGEYVKDVVKRAEKYLEDNGINNPLVYPVSANLTALLRKRELNTDLLTRTERNQLVAMEDLFNEEPLMDLVEYMPLSLKTKAKLEQRGYPKALYRSGLPAVEIMIDDYIEKYSLPNRVTRANQALSQIIMQSTNAAELQKSLEIDQQELQTLEETINLLQAKHKKSSQTDGYITKLKTQKASLPKSAMQSFMSKQAGIRKLLADFGKGFDGRGTQAEADRQLERLSSDVESDYRRMIIDLEEIISVSQKQIKEDLANEYRKYISDLFSDVEDLELPVLQGLENQLNDFDFSLEGQEIQTEYKEVVTGTRTIKTSKWYKPWSWGGSEEVNEYKTVEEKYVDFVDVWDNREKEIRGNFQQLTKSAIEKAESNNETLIQMYVNFMSEQFEDKFNNLMLDLKEKIANADQRKIAIANAVEQLQKIEYFKAKVNDVLHV